MYDQAERSSELLAVQTDLPNQLPFCYMHLSFKLPLPAVGEYKSVR